MTALLLAVPITSDLTGYLAFWRLAVGSALGVGGLVLVLMVLVLLELNAIRRLLTDLVHRGGNG